MRHIYSLVMAMLASLATLGAIFELQPHNVVGVTTGYQTFHVLFISSIIGWFLAGLLFELEKRN